MTQEERQKCLEVLAKEAKVKTKQLVFSTFIEDNTDEDDEDSWDDDDYHDYDGPIIGNVRVNFPNCESRLGGGTVVVSVGQFPECCGIAVLANMQSSIPLSKAGCLAMLKLTRDEVRRANYGAAMYTTLTSNRYDNLNKALAEDGWKEINQFESPRTGNTIIVWYKDLTE